MKPCIVYAYEVTIARCCDTEHLAYVGPASVYAWSKLEYLCVYS